jgi:hypothetical protein
MPELTSKPDQIGGENQKEKISFLLIHYLSGGRIKIGRAENSHDLEIKNLMYY